MTIEEAYLSFLSSVEKNMTNDSISADKGRFVLLFNQAQNKYVRWIIKKGNSDERRAIEQLVVEELPMELGKRSSRVDFFKFPSNLFHFLNVYATAYCKDCGTESLTLWEVKHENVHELLSDENNKPSFNYRETFYTVGGGGINIYKDNFSINESYLTYYRYPKKVDISGYIKADGSISTSINPEFKDEVVTKILLIAVKDFASNESDFNKQNSINTQIITDF